MATDVSVVIVSYNTCALLRDCLQSVRASSTAPDEVFVVDNASVDGSQGMVASEFSDVTLIALERNLGFAGANNVALRRCRGSRILLLNPDATLAYDALARLDATLDAWPDAAAAGPRIPQHRWHAAVVRLSVPDTPVGDPAVLSTVCCRSPMILLESRWVRRPPVRRRWTGATVPACSYAAKRSMPWACSMSSISSTPKSWIGASNARRAGWSIVVDPRAVVRHHRGQSSISTGSASLSTALLVEPRLRYYRKNHAIVTAAAAALILAAGYLKQWRTDPGEARAKLRGVGRWLAACTRRQPHAHSRLG